MGRRLRVIWIFLPLVVGIVLLFFPRPSPVHTELDPPLSGETAREESIGPERLIFLLQYLGTDYATAVEGDQGVSPFEYQEMLDFSRLLVEQYERLDSYSEPLGELRQLREMIVHKRDPDEVRAQVQDLVPRLSQQFNVISYPRVGPSPSRGRKLYRDHCVKFHGLTGDGKGTSATKLDPSPCSFQSPRMNHLAPYQIFNATTFGVEGTDMPSHYESLDSPERWDISFYVLTLRSDFHPITPVKPLPLTLQDLAVYSNSQLLSKLREQGIEAAISEVDHYRSHPLPPSLQELLFLAQNKLDKSVRAYRKGEIGLALDLSLDAYLEGVEPVESALMQMDRSLTVQLEREFFRYQAFFRKGVPPWRA